MCVCLFLYLSNVAVFANMSITNLLSIGLRKSNVRSLLLGFCLYFTRWSHLSKNYSKSPCFFFIWTSKYVVPRFCNWCRHQIHLWKAIIRKLVLHTPVAERMCCVNAMCGAVEWWPMCLVNALQLKSSLMEIVIHMPGNNFILELSLKGAYSCLDVLLFLDCIEMWGLASSWWHQWDFVAIHWQFAKQFNLSVLNNN